VRDQGGQAETFGIPAERVINTRGADEVIGGGRF
jgi:hypothetical protein